MRALDALDELEAHWGETAGKFRRAIVVTDNFHLPRALFTFRRFGVEVTGSAAPG